MAKLNIPRTRELLQQFEFKRLFIEELGWSQPTLRKPLVVSHQGLEFEHRQIAELSGVVAFEISAKNGKIPDSKTRTLLYKDIAKQHHENLLVFLDRNRTQSLWYWVKREGNKTFPRQHLYVQGQPGDLFLSKLGGIVFDIGDFDQAGHIPVIEVAGRLKQALDVEPITKKFYSEFSDQHIAFLELIKGIPDERQRRWYASVLLNRLMFIYFLQRKGFIDNGNMTYLQAKLDDSRAKWGRDCYFERFLKVLFFEGFAKSEDQRSPETNKVLGSIRYLNGGLFLPHTVEQQNPKLNVPDQAFANLFALFQRYSWNLNDTPGGEDNEINPDVLGYIFEKYINQKAFGAYYTRPEITEYLCVNTIHRLILAAVNTSETVAQHIPGTKLYRYESVSDLLMDLDVTLCRRLLNEVLPRLSLLDPACGSGAFLVAAMRTLINLYAAIIGKIKFLNDRNLTDWLTKTEREHKSIGYFIKKRIITDNLYGVDIMEEATEIAKLRLFLALVASAESVEQLEPLPNIDFNILAGNSLIGLMRVTDEEFDRRHAQGNLFRKSYHDVLQEKNRLIDTYRHATTYAQDLTALRDDIQQKKQESLATLDDILLGEFKSLEIKFEAATWDTVENEPGKSKKRAVTIEDLHKLHPFHWGYEFDEIINARGGFDAIITNPPWEIFKPNGKEFFEEYSNLVTKKTMTIHEFERQQAKLLQDADIRKAWLGYLSTYPHQSAFFRAAPQYKNQISIVNGKKAGSDINLYKLFTEQCFNLLRPGGECGIVIPSGIYTDLGTKQLREMLFAETQVTSLFGFENRKEVFEGVHRSFKFVVLTFEKGSETKQFPAAFMRHDVKELERFPQEGAIDMSMDLIRRLSPDSLSVMEFKNDLDVRIAEKMLRFPLLGEQIEGTWNLCLTAEFHMTNDSHLFKTEPGTGRLPLYEGKMIWHFNHHFADARYWIDEKKGRKALLGSEVDTGKKLDYQYYRLGFRDVASSTNERSAISAIVPKNVFAGNTLPLIIPTEKQAPDAHELLLLLAVFNSFLFDWMIRNKITSHLNMFYVYQMPVPRLSKKDDAAQLLVNRAARLTCTTSEFDDLAKELGLKSHKDGATKPTECARLRAELDGLVAHLYGLTEEEFAYILTTFPIVPDPIKVAALNAYRDVERGLIS